MDQQPENQPQNQPQDQSPFNQSQPLVEPPEVEQPAVVPQPAPAFTEPAVIETPTTPVAESVAATPAPEPVTSQPISPFATAPITPVVASPVKKSPKGLIITIVAIIVVLLVAVGVWFAFFYVSKADYKKASTALNTVHTTYDNLRDDLSGVMSDMTDSASASTVKTDGDKLKTDLATYKQQFDDLGKQRALLDKDVKQKYDAAATQNKKFVAFIDSLAGSLDVLQKVSTDCASDKATSMNSATPDTILTAFDQAVGPCMTDLKDLSTSQNAALAKYATSVLAIYNQLRTGISDIQTAYKTKNSSAYYAAESEVSDASAKFYDVNANDLQTAANNVEVKDQMTALDTILSKKSS